jgi:hypothetical protein
MSVRERPHGRLTQTGGVAFASAREFDYLLRDERGDGVASIDELERAQRVLEHVAEHGNFFRIECVAVQQLPDGRNSCAFVGGSRSAFPIIATRPMM